MKKPVVKKQQPVLPERQVYQSGDLLRTLAQTPQEQKQLDDSIRMAVSEQMQPKDIFEDMLAHDVAEYYIDEQRIRRTQTALAKSAKCQALAGLLLPAYGNLDDAMKAAFNYLAPSNKQITADVQKKIDALGITPEQIEAHGMALRSNAVHTLDRMILNRHVIRVGLIKEHERRKRRAAKDEERARELNNSAVSGS